MKTSLIKFLVAFMLLSSFITNETFAQIKPQVVQGAPPPPGPISGPASVVMPTYSSQYTVPAISQGITLNWSFSPASAGSISASVNQATVTWNTSFNGTAQVTCTATNSYGTSAPSNLSVTVTGGSAPPPTVSAVSPASQTINYGANAATLSATAGAGSGTYYYQWQSSTNKVVWNNITNATSATYTPTGLTASTYYLLLVTSNGKTVASPSSFVIVNPATNPANVDLTFSNAMKNVFGTLNAANVPTGILRDCGLELTNLENFSGTTALVDSNFIDAEILRAMYTTIATSRMTTATKTTMPGSNVMDSLWYTARKPGQVTLCGIYYQYAYLNTSVNPNPNVTVTSGQLFDKYVGGVWQNPYLQSQTVGFAPAGSVYPSLNFKLMLPANLWFTNNAAAVSSIQIDAGDGLGYRTITPGTQLAVSYSSAGLKTWNFKVTLTNSTVLQSHSQITVKGTVDNSTCYGPQCGTYNPPTGGGGSLNALSANVIKANAVGATQDLVAGSYPSYYFQTAATYNGEGAQGAVTLLCRNGQSIVNPLIIVEGFDDGFYTTPESFAGTSSLSDLLNYNIANSASLNNLILSNYDIVYINFRNGTDDIRRNALLVSSVIRWVNTYKTSANKNVVLGLSMGGLCARYALKKMENNGETHQVGLFICHGSPEQGAEVPMGLQAMIIQAHTLYSRAFLGAQTVNDASTAFNSLAAMFNSPSRLPSFKGLLSLNETPAALQMLITHLNSSYQVDNTVHNQWESELSALGYPSQGTIKNLAISNGSECGQGQILTQGSSVMSFNAKLNTSLLGDLIVGLGGPVVAGPGGAILNGGPAFLLGVLPGRNAITANLQVNAQRDGGGNVGYYGNISYTKTILWLIPVSVTLSNRTFTNPAGVLPYETFPGDFFPLPNLTYTSGGWFGKYNIQMQIAPSFCYVPTPSVLDIQGSSGLAESDYTLPYSKAVPLATGKTTPFVNFITAYSGLSAYNSNNNNEQHITYENRNGTWLASVLGSGTPVADCTTLCQMSTITGSPSLCTGAQTYSVPSYSDVTYSWSTSSNLQIVSGQGTPSVQIQAVAGTAGQKGSISVSVAGASANTVSCGAQTLTQNVTIGIQPLVVTSTVDRSPQSSHYQYLTANATQLDNTTSANYQWYLLVNNQPTTLIGNGLILNHYPMAPGTTVFYQCQATTPCGLSTYNGYAYNDYSGTSAFIVYPNPANSVMSIAISQTTAATESVNITDVAQQSAPTAAKIPFTYFVYNKMGVAVLQGRSDDGSAVQFNTSNLPSDNYFVHIHYGSNVIKQQVIIAH